MKEISPWLLALLYVAACDSSSCSRCAGQGPSAFEERTGACGRRAPTRGSTVQVGGCLWFEHSGRTKYLHVCVRRAFEREAEVTTEWRLHEWFSEQGRSIEPERLSHHLAECEAVSRGEISFFVYDIGDGRVVIERY